jgi:hypothetical protein
MEGTNSFEKGLHRSNSPQMQPEGSYVDALNWIRNDSGRLTNEEIEEIIQPLTDAVSYKYLGSCPVQDSFIIFFQQLGNDGNLYSEIGIFNNNNPNQPYTRIFNDFFTNPVYRLNFNNSIDSVARINNKEEIVVYFVEEGNVPRRFNITEFENTGKYSSLAYNIIDDWNLQLNIKIPHANLIVEDDGGSIPSGTYSVCLRYITDINNKTTFGIPSRMIYITNDTGKSITVDGCPPQTQTDKKIKIQPINIDTNYPYIEPVIITYVGITNVLVIKSLGLYVNDGRPIYFQDESQYKESVSLEEINENPIFYSSAKCIEQKDNILIISNLTGKKYDRDFQKIANDIKVVWYYDTSYTDPNTGRFYVSDYIDKTNSTNQGGSLGTSVGYYDDNGDENGDSDDDLFGDGLKNMISKAYTSSAYEFHYKDGIEKKGFTRGEVYSFSITPIYKDGSLGFAYHVPAKPYTTTNGETTTDVFVSSESYPDYLLNDLNFPYNSTVSDGKIRHHRMPDYNSSGDMKCLDISKGVLKIKFENIVFSQTQKNLIQGYIIGYQPRSNNENTRIIEHGWAKPYIANGNFKMNSFFSGSCYNQFNDGSTMSSNLFDTGYMYYSPETELGVELNSSYKMQFYGWATERTTNGNKLFKFMDFNSDYKKMRNSNSGAFFDHFETIDDPNVGAYTLNDIKYTIKIDAIGEGNKTILGKYRIEFSKVYYHIESESNNQIFLSLSWPIYYIDNILGFDYQLRNQPDAGNARQIMNLNIAKNQYLPLFRIVNDIDFQYGQLQNAEYIPSEIIYDVNQTTILDVEGDTFLTKYFHHNLDGYRNSFTGSGYDSNSDVYNFEYIAGIWYESKNNYALRHYDELNNELPYYPKLDVLNNINTPKGIVNYEWYKRGFGYNKQYSASNNFKEQFAKPLFFNEITNYSNRSIYSKQSFENELIDQYRNFPALQYHDIPKHRGVITDTFVFNNNFFHHTEYGLWLSYFNPNTVQSTTQGDVVLGNAGIFKIPSKLILDIKGGYMGTMDKSGTNTPFGRVFLDHKQGKIFLFAGESPVEISDLGLFSFFRDFVNTTDKYTMGYDWANKRLLINNITQEKAISYYPKTETWTSLHVFSPVEYFTTNGYSYAYNNNEFFNLNNLNGLRKDSYITFVENTQPDAFKRFDRIEMNTMSGGNAGVNFPGFVEPNSYIFNDESFSKIHCWTDRQNTTDLTFAYEPNHDYNNNFLNSYNPSLVPANYYKSSFHAEFPLDAVVNPYANIFDNNNLNINADFRAHMKGKFLYTKLSYNGTNPLVLNYIKTFFKPTVA